MAKVLFFNGEQLEFPIVNGSQLWQGATFTRNSLANAFVGTTLTPFAADVPRFGSLTLGGTSGLVVEGSRTNSIRNNTMVGAVVGVVGSGGAMPTNWEIESGAGLTEEIIAIGSSNGIDYIDIKISGTPIGAAYARRYESLSQIPASSTQTWTGSQFFAIVGGNSTNIASINNRIVFVATSANSQNMLPTLTGSLQRYSNTLTAPASTTNVYNMFSMGLTIGLAVDITLRIGLPQLELGSFESSPIKTLGSAAVTRAASVPLIEDVNTKPWFNASEFTVIAEFEIPQFVTSQRILAFGTAGSLLNRIEILTTGTSARLFVEGGSGAVADFTAAGLVAGASNKIALRCKLDDYAMSVNGGAVGTDTSAIVPPVTALFLGMSTVSGNHLNGVIKSLTLIPRGLTNAQLQALSS
jgi:hypothetical protein